MSQFSRNCKPMWTANRMIICELLFIFDRSVIKTADHYEMVTKYII